MNESVLKDLEPKEVLKYFEAICDLPHGSHNTKLLSDYCVLFARIRGLWCHQDKVGNVIIRKPASAGYENHPTVIIQGHLDMVCEKEQGKQIDFRRDGITLRLEGDMITADGTTLGADDGIAVAYALAILDNKNLCHPPLEILLTVDEEVGMLGAVALDASLLHGKTLINIDSDTEGVLTLGCAGGLKGDLTLLLRRENVTGTHYTLSLDGLCGGHSGVEINCGHTNAILHLGRLFASLCEGRDLRPCGFTGGGKDNAIPRHATLKFISPQPLDDAARSMIEENLKKLRETEPGATLTLTEGGNVSQGALTQQVRDKFIRLLTTVPNGVQKMSPLLPKLVQTSLNLGIVSFDKLLTLTFALRSSVNQERDELSQTLKTIAEEVGARWQTSSSYPAWEMREESHLRDTMVQVWRDVCGGECRTDVIHAGLECGILADKIPDLDCVSFGPNMTDIHTPREALSVSSVARTWQYLLAVLKAL